MILILLFFQQTPEYEYIKGKPSSNGVCEYIKKNEYELIEEFKAYVNDTMLNEFDVYLETDDLSQYTGHDTLELGRFYIPGDIVITNETLFADYELQYMSKYKRRQYVECNQFVKSAVMHELSHWYFYILTLHVKNTDPSYTTSFRTPPYAYGAEFIEEGVCEYISACMGQMIPYGKPFKPSNVNAIIEGRNTYDIKYRWSMQYVKAILDTMELKKGVELLISNKPPANEEILHPELFYNRIR